jgi:hypothetical protein
MSNERPIITHSFRWLREVGILLLTISLLFLPWFRDPYPLESRTAIIMGREFISYGAWAVLWPFACFWLAYLLSRLSSRQWLALFPLIIAVLLYLYVHALIFAPNRFNPMGLPLNRWNHLSDKQFDLLWGGWVNGLGVLLLVTGMYQVESARGRQRFIWGILGAIIGWLTFLGLLSLDLHSFMSQLRRSYFRSLEAETWQNLYFTFFCLTLPCLGLGIALWLTQRHHRERKFTSTL